MTTPHFLAIEIGGTKLQLCAGAGDGNIVDRRRFQVDRARGAEGIREQIAQAVPELIAKWQPAAIGVGYGGPVDWRSGRIWRSYHISGWSDFPLGDWLREQTGLPVFAENDSNLATLGEAICGAGKGMNPVFYTNMGSGVGGGLAVDGRIYHGALPGEMEFGHLRLHGPERILEDDCSGWSLDCAIRVAVENAPESHLAQLVAADPGGEARHLKKALEAGDEIATTLLKTLAGHLTNALGVVVQLLHPEVIVIGGGVSLIGEPLRAAVAERLPNFIMDVFHPGPQVRLAGLREDSVPVGALLMAADRLSTSKKEKKLIMKTWLQSYIAAQHRAVDSVPLEAVAKATETVRTAWENDRQIFAIGNGGSAANASHFATDLGKGSSDAVGKRFRVQSLTDNLAWITALGNDYSYEDIFLRQLQNFARAGDVLITASVSGSSPNLVKAFTWAKKNGLHTIAMVGAKRGTLAGIAEQVIVVDDTHYGRVEDVHMHIFHMICYSFMEKTAA